MRPVIHRILRKTCSRRQMQETHTNGAVGNTAEGIQQINRSRTQFPIGGTPGELQLLLKNNYFQMPRHKA